MHSQHYLQDDSTESLQTSVWWPTSTSASLSLSCCTSPKQPPFLLSLRTSQTVHAKVVTLLCVFSAACNLDSEKSSATGHNLPVLLLLSRHWVLAVAVLLPHLMKNSVPIHRKNIQATQVKCSRNDNCDKLESRKPISKQRKRQKALDFSDFVFQLLYLIKGGTKMNQRQYYRLFCLSIAARRFHAISCYVIKEPPTAPYSPLQPLPLQRIGF